MEHRYGRHGPRAWLRWRQRRYARPSQLPVPVEPQPTIVRVFVPANAGRIIFIIMTDDPNIKDTSWQPPAELLIETGQQNTDGRTDQSFDGSNGQPQLPPPEEAIERLKQLADLAGRKRANEEVEVGDPDNLPSRQQLQREANTFAYQAIMDQVRGGATIKRDMNTLCREIADICLQIYYKEIETFEHEGTIPDERTRAIREVAWVDKASHQAQNKFLSPEYVRYLGVARAMRDLGIDTELNLEELDDIHAYVDVYRIYYQQPARELKEGDRLPRPREF